MAESALLARLAADLDAFHHKLAEPGAAAGKPAAKTG
jgi:hypothetical protein